jgi:hypothetical protein
MGTIKKLTILFVLAVVYAKLHKIGKEQYCMVDYKEHTIQCNYQTMKECQTYMLDDQMCVKNKDYHK